MSRRKQSCPQHLTSKNEDGPFALLQQEDEKNKVDEGSIPAVASLESLSRTPDHEDDEDALLEADPLQEGDVLSSEDNPSPSSVSVTEGSAPIGSEEDVCICSQCRAEFVGLTAFVMHKKNCSKRPVVLPIGLLPAGAGDESRSAYPSIGAPSEDAIRTGIDQIGDKEGRRGELRSPFSTRQIPLSAVAHSPAATCSSSDISDDERLTPSPSKLSKEPGNEWPSSGSSDLGASVVLTSRLQNTNVAVAQQLAPSNADSEAGLPPKTLQATLTSLQQHQLMLMSVIHQMQAQLATNGQEHRMGQPPQNLPLPIPFMLPPSLAAHVAAKGSLNPDAQPVVNQPVARSTSLSPTSRSPSHRQRQSLHHHRSLRGDSPSPPVVVGSGGDPLSKAPSFTASSAAGRLESHKPVLVVPGSGDSAVATTADSNNIILSPTDKNNTNNENNKRKESGCSEKGSGSPPTTESSLNTLELLQLHTEKALQNTMSGSSFLVNGISGLGGPDFLKFRKDGKEDPSYRHRCRYCGKVFGSDSALQIHIRSHTGERPFKCNICGNRFSTKGNLKVHFQRHRAKYPHVKMNPNPVPEHLDKFHPPLEPPSGSQSPSRSDSSPPPHASASSTAPSSYAGLFGQSSASSSAAVFDGIRGSFPTGREFPSARSRLGSFFKQLDAAKSGSSSKDRNRSPPSTSAIPVAHDLSGVSFAQLNDASNMSMTEESDRESDDRHEGERVSGRKRPSDTADPAAETLADDAGQASGGTRSDPRDAKREKRSRESYFHEDRQIKQEKNADDDEDEDEDVLSDDEDKSAVANGKNDRNHATKDLESDPDAEDSSNAASSAGNRDEDESDGLSNQSGATGSVFPGLMNASNFQNYFPPGMFPGSLAGMLPPGFAIPPGLHADRAADPNAPPGTLAGDPHLYQDLLPKPGSNDNAWESLMEIQKASETTKLQHLVDNIENKLTDPNQCIICHRVLSCKSALQMHYRTHTGERPFKCKLCNRAFTTKGNLKTHMGVHRVKPPLRILHQCPVCHKQFANALVLQQHIRMHTGEPTDIPPEHIMANEIKHSSQLLPSFHRQPIGLSPFAHFPPVTQAAVNPFFAQLMNSQFGQHLHQRQQQLRLPVSGRSSIELPGRKEEAGGESPKNQNPPDSDIIVRDIGNPDRCSVSTVTSDKETHSLTPHPRDSPPQQLSPSNNSNKQAGQTPNPFSVSLTALEKHVKTITTLDPASMPMALQDASKAMRESLSRAKTTPDGGKQADVSQIRGRSSSRNQTISPASVNSRDAPSIDGSASMNADDQRSSPGSGRMGDENSRTMDSVPGNGALDLTPRGSSGGLSPMSVGSRGLPSPGMIRPPHMFPPLFAGLPFPTGKSSTTCQICMKTFACNSALEIHYRSHTKERPFKCDVCDRGFSTKGNMKQHMLTHKIRDLPANLYTTTTTTTTTASVLAPASASGRQPPPRTPSIADSNSQTSVTTLTEAENGKSESNGQHSPAGGSDRRSSSNSNSSPAAKARSSSSSSSHASKHVCPVCTKPFSSHSALTIHMRTHTGDKPFKCTICGRAFTTKGNLKVHMGTHMWNNGSSRRGRRMSIDLPNMHVTPPSNGGADGFPQSFFSSLPIAYMNGMNGQNNRMAANNMSSVYAAQFQAKLQACHSDEAKGRRRLTSGDPLPHSAVRSDDEENEDEDEDEASHNSDDEDSPVKADRNGDGSVGEEESDDRSTPRSWIKTEQQQQSPTKLSPASSGKALTAS